MRVAAHVLVPILSLFLVQGAAAQQPNTPAASLTLDGVDGAPYPIQLPLNVQTWNPDLTLHISGPPLQPFILAATPAGVLPARPPTPWGLFDLDISGGISIILDGLQPISPASLLAYTSATGEWSATVPLWPGAAGIDAALQCLMSVPGSPGGFVFTAATHLTTVDVPTSAVFVSHSRGAPGNPGTAGSPFFTLQQGVNAALAAGLPYPEVRVEHGTYAFSGPYALVNGMNVVGGLDAVSWLPVPGARSTLDFGTSGGSLTLQSALLPTTITSLEVVTSGFSPFQPSPTSAALVLFNCGASLTFVGCRFEAGDGGPGAPGFSPSQSSGGSNGAGPTGATGGTGGLGGSGACNGGNGGNGGAAAGGNGQSGQQGSCTGGSGGSSSAGSFCGGTSNAGSGSTGGGGAVGAGGSHGPTPSGIVHAPGTWDPFEGTQGGSGGGGKGGGGGGGSGGNACTLTTGNAGGGGGGGGFGGAGGGPGQCGGASFAVLLHGSSPTFQDCEFVTGAGGAGASGGQGGAGGAGGFGAGGATTGGNVGNGGFGGSGGSGGRGGGGAGGVGGFTFGVYRNPTSFPTLVGATVFNVGPPGAGGAGGLAPGGNPGQAGPAGLTGTIN